ncbi:hypothetical protein ACK12G_13640 [Mycolicibacterium wolinskyi]|uniref:hypothetical protein n=1 Tax=Mycolicibacterium wolinskyi TaxID=59750 RepID=UPI003917A633
MNVSVRSYLMAGAAAATATTLALTPIQVTPDDIAVPAHSVSTEPQLSQAMVDLLAAASRMTAAVPVPKVPSGGASGAVESAPAAAVTAAPTALAIAPNLANTIDNIYLTFEPWVQYGFELGAYALGWVPWVGGWAGGLLMDGYNFGNSLVASAVFNFTDWLRGDGGIAQNLVDFGVDVALSFVWLGIDVANTFIPLPPLPLPPRPPLQGPFLAADLAAPTANLAAAPSIASLPSLIGDLILPPVEAATNAAIAANNLTLATSQAVTEGVINAIEPVFDGLGLGLVNQQIDINYNLLNALSIQEVGFVNDLIGVPEGFLTDVLRNGEGPLRALGTQARFVVDSAVDHGSASVDALGNYVRDQIDFFTPDLATKTGTAVVTSVPESVRTLVKSTDTTGATDTVTTPDTEATETEDTAAPKPARTLAKNVQEAVDKTVAKTAADVKKVSENVRDAVKDATKAASSTKTSDKDSETASDKTTEKKSEAAKPAKKDKPAGADKADKADKKQKSEKSD